MAFHIQITERDETFLLTCRGIPEEARDRILTLAWEQLSTITDEARLEPQIRDVEMPECFWHHSMFLGDGCLQTLRFIVDDSGASAGVLRIVYVDLVEGRPLQRLE